MAKKRSRGKKSGSKKKRDPAAENVEQFDRVESPTPAAKQVSVESPTPAAK